MGEFAHLEVDEHEALEQVIVENQIHEKRVGVGPNVLLAGHKGEAFAEFEQEFLQVIQKTLFEFPFVKPGFGSNFRKSST